MSNHVPTTPGARGTARLPAILLVEDNPRDVRLIKEVLAERKLECELRLARDGEQALRMLRRQGEYADMVAPDLVLLDINLPILSGIEVLEQIKQDPLLRTIPVLILSTSAAESDVLQCYALHANSYLVKPADFDEFSRMVAEIHAFWIDTALPPPAPRMPRTLARPGAVRA